MVHFERKPEATILDVPLVRLRFGARLSSQTALMYETSAHLVAKILEVLSTINYQLSTILKLGAI